MTLSTVWVCALLAMILSLAAAAVASWSNNCLKFSSTHARATNRAPTQHIISFLCVWQQCLYATHLSATICFKSWYLRVGCPYDQILPSLSQFLLLLPVGAWSNLAPMLPIVAHLGKHHLIYELGYTNASSLQAKYKSTWTRWSFFGHSILLRIKPCIMFVVMFVMCTMIFITSQYGMSIIGALVLSSFQKQNAFYHMMDHDQLNAKRIYSHTCNCQSASVAGSSQCWYISTSTASFKLPWYPSHKCL